MKNKVISIDSAMDLIQDGMTIMVGGFLGAGSPDTLIDAIVKKGVKDITLISNDTGFTDIGVGKWIVNKQIKHVITSHIGTNRETGNQMNSGEIDVTLVPQGTLIERIRCAGGGLGGVLTPTGIGTIVEEGKQKLTIEGKEIKMTIGNTLEKYGVAPSIIADRTFVPVRFVADELGAETVWDDTAKTVTITKTAIESK